MIGEKFVERKVEGNKIITINEFKDFPYDYMELAVWINDCVTDDYEDIFHTYGVTFSWDDLYAIDCDQAGEGLSELLETWEAENKEGEEHDVETLKKYIAELDKAQGYTIYFTKDKDYYEKGFKAVE